MTAKSKRLLLASVIFSACSLIFYQQKSSQFYRFYFGLKPRTCREELLGVPESLQRLTWCPRCQEITCELLISSDPEQNKTFYKEVKELMIKYSSTFNKPDRITLLQVLKENCEAYKSWRDYDVSGYGPRESLNNQSDPFSIAFNILAHRDFEQTERLLRAIYRPQNSYCIHVDNKYSVLVEDIKTLSDCFDNVFLASKLENVTYAGFSRLQADINCMADHLKTNIKWKYLINTAATAFPLRTNAELVEIFKIYNGSNEIVTIDTRRNNFLKSRFEKVYEEKNGKIIATTEKHSPPPHNLTIVKGSAYGSFSREFVEFLINDEISRTFLNWCRDTYSPDEHFWQTLHHTYSNPHVNAPGGFKGVHNLGQAGTFYVAWAGEKPCHGKFVRGICIFGVSDLPVLTSVQKLFVNKFHKDFEPLAMECLDNFLRYKRQCSSVFDLNYYRRLPFLNQSNNSSEISTAA